MGMKFGTFGRENGVLLLVTQGGALSIKILRRSVNFEVKEAHPGPPRSQLSKLNIPKRTKVYIDQMMREKEIGTGKKEERKGGGEVEEKDRCLFALTGTVEVRMEIYASVNLGAINYLKQ